MFEVNEQECLPIYQDGPYDIIQIYERNNVGYIVTTPEDEYRLPLGLVAYSKEDAERGLRRFKSFKRIIFQGSSLVDGLERWTFICFRAPFTNCSQCEHFEHEIVGGSGILNCDMDWIEDPSEL